MKMLLMVLVICIVDGCGGGGALESPQKTEIIDTDGDGIPNTLDSDDDGDMVLDINDAYPLISLGTNVDTDMDGRPDECNSACMATGLTADTDDDGDGALDFEDPFPLLDTVTRSREIPTSVSILRIEQ